MPKTRPRHTLTLLVLLLGCATAGGEPPRREPPQLRALGDFRVSYYWVAVEREADRAQPRDQLLRDMQGRPLAWVSRDYRRRLELEGTGRLADGRVLNVAGRRDGELRFCEVQHAWGLGVGERPLEPFVSVATDPKLVATGSWLYVERLAGYRLPGGRTHDGLVRADDVGSAIRGRRIDIFIGEHERLEAVERELAPTGDALRVWLAAAATPDG